MTVLPAMRLKPQQKMDSWSMLMPCSRTPKHDTHGNCSRRNTSHEFTLSVSAQGLCNIDSTHTEWRSVCQIHAVIHFRFQLTEEEGQVKHSFLTLWQWMSCMHSHNPAMKHQSGQQCSLMLSHRAFFCERLVLAHVVPPWTAAKSAH